jgi:hypothetical protein
MFLECHSVEPHSSPQNTGPAKTCKMCNARLDSSLIFSSLDITEFDQGESLMPRIPPTGNDDEVVCGPNQPRVSLPDTAQENPTSAVTLCEAFVI